MKILLRNTTALLAAVILLLQGCESFDSKQTTDLLNLVDNYSKDFNLLGYKQMITDAFNSTGNKQGLKPGSAEKIIDNISIETKRYLRDVAAVLKKTNGGNGLESVFMNSFNLYKQLVEQDIPRLLPGKNNTGGQIALSDADIKKVLDDVERKNNLITRQLKAIEERAGKQAEDFDNAQKTDDN
jgi:parvulin-like peptidyl-prolyl isomerase